MHAFRENRAEGAIPLLITCCCELIQDAFPRVLDNLTPNTRGVLDETSVCIYSRCSEGCGCPSGVLLCSALKCCVGQKSCAQREKELCAVKYSSIAGLYKCLGCVCLHCSAWLDLDRSEGEIYATVLMASLSFIAKRIQAISLEVSFQFKANVFIYSK